MSQQQELTPTPTETPCTRIVALHSENVMRLKAVDLTPPEHLVIVAGDNEQGKSSLLRSIEIALQGAEAFPKMPVRKGQAKATVELDLGTLTVRRTITQEGGTTLTVKGKDGAVLNSPQKILTELIGKRSFDPMEFMKLRPEHRADLLRRIAGLDFTQIDADRAKAYTERTLVNRELEAARVKLASLKPKHPDAPAEEVSGATILAEQKAASEKNQENARKRSLLSETKSEAEQLTADITAYESQISDLQKLVERDRKVLEETRKRQEAMEIEVRDLQDANMEEFATKLTDVEQSNAKLRHNRARETVETDYKAAEEKSTKLTRQIDRLDTQKADMIQNAKYPVPGLGFTDSGAVAVEGIPFEQCSTSKQLRVSVAMGLALNPKLRVLLIRNGNDLDDKNLALLAEMAKESNSQIWLERVDSKSGDVAVVIEDGMVKEVANA